MSLEPPLKKKGNFLALSKISPNDLMLAHMPLCGQGVPEKVAETYLSTLSKPFLGQCSTQVNFTPLRSVGIAFARSAAFDNSLNKI
jgi:hypothetical protein